MAEGVRFPDTLSILSRHRDRRRARPSTENTAKETKLKQVRRKIPLTVDCLKRRGYNSDSPCGGRPEGRTFRCNTVVTYVSRQQVSSFRS